MCTQQVVAVELAATATAAAVAEAAKKVNQPFAGSVPRKMVK